MQEVLGMPKIDVVKENLQFQQFVRESVSKTILKDEYLIPDTHPDVDEILMVQGTAKIIDSQIVNNKIIVEGNVEYNIIYIPREEGMMLNSVKYTEKFSNSLELDESEHKIDFVVKSKIEHIQSKVINERKIEIETLLEIYYELYNNVHFDIVKEIEATDGVQTLKNNQNINRLVANSDIELQNKSLIRVGMDKPQINKILNFSAMLYKKEVKLLEDKALLSCYCKVDILYLGGENGEVINLQDDVYISSEEEIAGASQEMIPNADFELKSIDIVVEEDDLGEARIVNVEIDVNVHLEVFSDEKLEVVDDAYSTKFPVEIVKKEQKIPVIENIKSVESVVKDKLSINQQELRPEYIHYISAHLGDIKKNVSENKINIDGKINAAVLFKNANEGKEYGAVSGEIPFTATLDIGGINEQMKSVVKSYIDSIEAIIEGNSIAIKARIITDAKVSSDIQKKFISNVVESDGEMNNKNASIIIYVIDKGERLWDLAKKFNTTVDELIKINSIEDIDSINDGDKLIIPGRAIF